MGETSARVLLIYPPSRTHEHYTCPMGMLMVAGALEEAGCRVDLADANAWKRRLSADDIVERAREIRPDVIGMTLVTPLVREGYRLAARLRPLGIPLLAGGPHATLLPEEPVAHGFDASVVGEGEPTAAEAVAALTGRRPLDGVRGLAFRGPDGAVRRTAPRPLVENLDTLPPPARHLVRPEDYGAERHGIHMNLFSSRGCPARCSYCAGGLFGKGFRYRSADGVVDEMNRIADAYGTREFHFFDDAMTIDKPRIRRICERLITESRGFRWSMMTRIDTVREESMLALLARAGCSEIDFGIESGCPETLKRIHKPHTVEMVRRTIPLVARHGIRPQVFFIVGFPWEGADALDETFQLMRDLSPHVEFHPAVGSVLVPFPGTEIYDRYHEEYGFTDWWLRDDYAFDAPTIRTHPFYQTVLYRIGMVLDADFFRYPPEVRARIHDIFRFMHASNLRGQPRVVQKARLAVLDVSRAMHQVTPTFERVLLRAPAHAAWQAGKRLLG